MYGTLFSKVYDAFGWNFYPEEFAELLLKWMQEKEIRVERMLDIGCGTGVLCHFTASLAAHCGKHRGAWDGSFRGND